MSLMKQCARCGKLIPQGTSCTCGDVRHREYTKYRRDENAHAFYSSAWWKRVRDAVKSRACGCDELIRHENKRIEPGEIVHHIVPLEEDRSLAMVPGNLIMVTRSTHRQIHEAYEHGDKAEMQQRLYKAIGGRRMPG